MLRRSQRTLWVAFFFLALVAACNGKEAKDAKDPSASAASGSATSPKDVDGPAKTLDAQAPAASAAAPGPAISREDAQGAVITLLSATSSTVKELPERARILMQGCRDLPSCAGACKDALAKAGTPLTRDADKDGILAECFADFKQEHDKRGLSREDWIVGYMAAYADRVIAANVLEGKNAQALRDARAKLQAPAASTASGPALSRKDGEGLARTLGAATFGTNRDPAERAQILMAGCSEIPSCAGACKDALAKASSPGVRRADADGALAGCFADFKQEHDKRGLSKDDWIEGYIAAYADRVIAANVLQGEDAKALRETRAKLHPK